MCQKYLKNVCIKRCPTFLKIYFQNVCVGLEGTKCTTLLNYLLKLLTATTWFLKAKLNAYGVDILELRLIFDYLTNRKQRAKIGNNYSRWREILYGVPQRSILGPLLFNIFICDLFLITDDFEMALYADDTRPYVCGKDITSVIRSLENAAEIVFIWFKNNQIYGNEE